MKTGFIQTFTDVSYIIKDEDSKNVSILLDIYPQFRRQVPIADSNKTKFRNVEQVNNFDNTMHIRLHLSYGNTFDLQTNVAFLTMNKMK